MFLSLGRWGGFFGSKPDKSAAERLAELRARAEQERVRREMEKMRVSRVTREHLLVFFLVWAN
jgi:hypothetical protein